MNTLLHYTTLIYFASPWSFVHFFLGFDLPIHLYIYIYIYLFFLTSFPTPIYSIYCEYFVLNFWFPLALPPSPSLDLAPQCATLEQQLRCVSTRVPSRKLWSCWEMCSNATGGSIRRWWKLPLAPVERSGTMRWHWRCGVTRWSNPQKTMDFPRVIKQIEVGIGPCKKGPPRWRTQNLACHHGSGGGLDGDFDTDAGGVQTLKVADSCAAGR